jgi:hypothetical protein
MVDGKHPYHFAERTGRKASRAEEQDPRVVSIARITDIDEHSYLINNLLAPLPSMSTCILLLAPSDCFHLSGSLRVFLGRAFSTLSVSLGTTLSTTSHSLSTSLLLPASLFLLSGAFAFNLALLLFLAAFVLFLLAGNLSLALGCLGLA